MAIPSSAQAFALSLQVLEIVWINLLLSGDNAVVIALACRGLPPRQRRLGILLGAGAAVLLRVAFTFVVVELLALPYLKIVSGLALLWIAVKLVTDEAKTSDIAAAPSLWQAVWTITIADAIMSLDNVLAIAAAARGAILLIVFGLLLSIPLVVFGSTLVMKLIDRLPWLVWAGAALLGWVAGELIASDPFAESHLHPPVGDLDDWAGVACIAVVLVAAGIVTAIRRRGSVRQAQ